MHENFRHFVKHILLHRINIFPHAIFPVQLELPSFNSKTNCKRLLVRPLKKGQYFQPIKQQPISTRNLREIFLSIWIIFIENIIFVVYNKFIYIFYTTKKALCEACHCLYSKSVMGPFSTYPSGLFHTEGVYDTYLTRTWLFI